MQGITNLKFQWVYHSVSYYGSKS